MHWSLWFIVALVIGAFYRCYTLEKEIAALNERVINVEILLTRSGARLP